MRDRRSVLASIGSIGTFSIAGCVSGRLVDTTYDCDTREPETIPEEETPTIGDEERPLTVEFHVDLSRAPAITFLSNTLEQVYENHVQENEINLKMYDSLVESNGVWSFELASALRYIYITGGEEAYLATIRKILQDEDEEAKWQHVGDGASENGVDPCVAISHGKYLTYEERSHEDRNIMLETDISQSPAVVVGNERITEMTPFSEVYTRIAETISDKTDQ